MQHQSKQVLSGASSSQRSIILAALEHEHGISRSALSAELDDLGADTIVDALAVLAREGVIILDGERVRASRCAMHLDTLSLICV